MSLEYFNFLHMSWQSPADFLFGLLYWNIPGSMSRFCGFFGFRSPSTRRLPLREELWPPFVSPTAPTEALFLSGQVFYGFPTWRRGAYLTSRNSGSLLVGPIMLWHCCSTPFSYILLKIKQRYRQYFCTALDIQTKVPT
uniref:Uncharacterized protein n=1 Tax=Sphaerodactylus townsendi TaxID=933632 RepID=A0ACB8GAE2_9SAUR